MNELVVIANVLLSFAVIVIWGGLVIFIVFLALRSKIQKRKFYRSVVEILAGYAFDLERAVSEIKNCYAAYRNNRYGFSSKKIILICQEISQNLRLGKGLDVTRILEKDTYADRLGEVITQLQNEEQFDDEKANEIINAISGQVDKEILDKVRQKLTFLEAYHKGVIGVKDVEIRDLKAEKNRKHWITGVSGALGVIGTILSILSYFK